MDRDALRTEFAALVKPFEQSRNLAISTPQVDIVDIIRHFRTAHVPNMPKLADQAEELVVCYSRVLSSLIEERDAVYNISINKVTSQVVLICVVQSRPFTNLHRRQPVLKRAQTLTRSKTHPLTLRTQHRLKIKPQSLETTGLMTRSLTTKTLSLDPHSPASHQSLETAISNPNPETLIWTMYWNRSSSALTRTYTKQQICEYGDINYQNNDTPCKEIENLRHWHCHSF
jgi:hypothetical protein